MSYTKAATRNGFHYPVDDRMAGSRFVASSEGSLNHLRSFIGIRLEPMIARTEKSASPPKLPRLVGKVPRQTQARSPEPQKKQTGGLFFPKLQRNPGVAEPVPRDINHFLSKWTKNERKSYSCYIGSGNTDAVIAVLKQRRCWTFSQNMNDPQVQFVWKQTIAGISFETYSNQQPGRARVFNHFDNHREISQKDLLLKNMYRYCVLQGVEVFDYLPPTFEARVDRRGAVIGQEGIKLLFELMQRSPPGSVHLMSALEEAVADGVIKSAEGKLKLAQLFHGQAEVKEIPACMHEGHNLWIIKPIDCNRGNGIEILSRFTDLQKCVQNVDDKVRSTKGVNLPVSKVLVQKYIERPMLITERKFDIRMWVLLDSMVNLYIFPEGYLRLSSEKYTCTDSSKYIHLTNNAIQQYSKGYGEKEAGNQLSFKDLKSYFSTNQEYAKLDFEKGIMQRILKVTKMAFASVHNKINQNRREKLFELFGMDFMLDENAGVWLIEVNTNPCLALSSPLLEKLIPRMLDDALKMVLDPVFPPEIQGGGSQTVYAVPGYSNSENMWIRLS